MLFACSLIPPRSHICAHDASLALRVSGGDRLLCATSLSMFPPHHPCSPYNALLSAHKLLQHADCVLPLDNQALLEIVERAKYGCHLMIWATRT